MNNVFKCLSTEIIAPKHNKKPSFLMKLVSDDGVKVFKYFGCESSTTEGVYKVKHKPLPDFTD
jgi:hypothetical protein